MKSLSFLSTTFNILKRRWSAPAANNHFLAVNEQLKYSEWTGKENQDWMNDGNWSNGLPFRHLHAFIPRIPLGNHFPILTEDTDINFTIKNEGVLVNQSRMAIEMEGLIQNEGILENQYSGQLVIKGKLVNNGTIKNAGLINQLHIFCNTHIIENTGTITNEQRILRLEKVLSDQQSGEISLADLTKSLNLS